jgi:hypothetical protein
MSACALCRTPAPPPFRAPAPEGSPDLDGRPGEPTRSTLLRWLQTCDGCGACAPDLAALPASAQEAVQIDTYHTLDSPFERWAALVVGTPEEAEAWLQAAWLAEDSGEDATPQRRRALAVWPKPADAEGMVRLADIQRRAGLLADAAATLDMIPRIGDDGLARIVAFERARLLIGDTGRHLLSSALRPPARTPHVSHGKRTATGFWSRVFGTSKP